MKALTARLPSRRGHRERAFPTPIVSATMTEEPPMKDEITTIDRALNDLLVNLGNMVLRLAAVTTTDEERTALVRSVKQTAACGHLLPGDSWLERPWMFDGYGWLSIYKPSQKSMEPPSDPPPRNWQEQARVTPLQGAAWRELRHAFPEARLCVAGDLNMNLGGPQIFSARLAELDEIGGDLVGRIGEQRRGIDQRQLLGRDTGEVGEGSHGLGVFGAAEELAELRPVKPTAER
eukprot:gene35489-47716_t